MRATQFHWPIKPRTCAVVPVNNSRSIWENIDPHGYGKIRNIKCVITILRDKTGPQIVRAAYSLNQYGTCIWSPIDNGDHDFIVPCVFFHVCWLTHTQGFFIIWLSLIGKWSLPRRQHSVHNTRWGDESALKANPARLVIVKCQILVFSMHCRYFGA